MSELKTSPANPMKPDKSLNEFVLEQKIQELEAKLGQLSAGHIASQLKRQTAKLEKMEALVETVYNKALYEHEEYFIKYFDASDAYKALKAIKEGKK